MAEIALAVFASAIIFGLIGSSISKKRGHPKKIGFLFGFFLGPIGIIIFLLLYVHNSQIPADAVFDGKQELESDRYQLWLTQKYNIVRNETLARYVVRADSFATLQDAFAYADHLEDTQKLQQNTDQKRASIFKKRLVYALIFAAAISVSFLAFDRMTERSAKEKLIQTIAEQRVKAGFISTPSGLMYKIILAGNGPRPKQNDTVLVHYEGKLSDGTIFDSSWQRGQPAAFPLNQVITGWSEGLQLMKTGAKYELIVPPSLAFGNEGSGGVIPPGAELTFSINLLAIRPAE
jgi:FKBP-type peptidyl-prolyl cis-trans isomerase